jgi:hypothetical protein
MYGRVLESLKLLPSFGDHSLRSSERRAWETSRSAQQKTGLPIVNFETTNRPAKLTAVLLMSNLRMLRAAIYAKRHHAP